MNKEQEKKVAEIVVGQVRDILLPGKGGRKMCIGDKIIIEKFTEGIYGCYPLYTGYRVEEAKKRLRELYKIKTVDEVRKEYLDLPPEGKKHGSNRI